MSGAVTFLSSVGLVGGVALGLAGAVAERRAGRARRAGDGDDTDRVPSHLADAGASTLSEGPRASEVEADARTPANPVVAGPQLNREASHEAHEPAAERSGATSVINLSLPAEAQYLRLVRLMASGVATSYGMPLEDVEDFRIAVDELCSALVEISRSDRIGITFRIDDDRLVVEARARSTTADDLDEERLQLSRHILDVAVDQHAFRQGEAEMYFSASKRVRSRGVR